MYELFLKVKSTLEFITPKLTAFIIKEGSKIIEDEENI